MVDAAYLKRELEALKTLYQNKEYTGVIGRLSQSGLITSKGLPALNTAAEMMAFYNQYQSFSEMKDSADSAFKQLEQLSQSYLQQVTFVRKSNQKPNGRVKPNPCKSSWERHVFASISKALRSILTSNLTPLRSVISSTL